MATERSLERCAADAFDLLLRQNPDGSGYTSEAVCDALEDNARRRPWPHRSASRPAPSTAPTLFHIDCFERFGERLDWAMIILNPLEPWPGELLLDAGAATDVELITRVVDYGGLFHDDVLPGHPFPRDDHRSFRPQGWVERGREKIERMRPIAEQTTALTMLQLACAWNLPTSRWRASPHADPGAGRGRATDRGQAAELAACRARPHAPPKWPRSADRRQHRLHEARRARRPTSWPSRCPNAGRSVRPVRAGRPLAIHLSRDPYRCSSRSRRPGTGRSAQRARRQTVVSLRAPFQSRPMCTWSRCWRVTLLVASQAL